MRGLNQDTVGHHYETHSTFALAGWRCDHVVCIRQLLHSFTALPRPDARVVVSPARPDPGRRDFSGSWSCCICRWHCLGSFPQTLTTAIVVFYMPIPPDMNGGTGRVFRQNTGRYPVAGPAPVMPGVSGFPYHMAGLQPMKGEESATRGTKVTEKGMHGSRELM